MMILVQGTGALVVLILIGIAILLVSLLLLAAARGSVKPRNAWLSIGLVVVAMTLILGLHGRSGGEFPRILWRGSARRIHLPARLPLKALPARPAS